MMMISDMIQADDISLKDIRLNDISLNDIRLNDISLKDISLKDMRLMISLSVTAIIFNPLSLKLWRGGICSRRSELDVKQ